MKETVDLLGKIITNILTALYEPFGFSLLLSFLAMFFYLYAYEPTEAGKGWKNAIVTWYQKLYDLIQFVSRCGMSIYNNIPDYCYEPSQLCILNNMSKVELQSYKWQIF